MPLPIYMQVSAMDNLNFKIKVNVIALWFFPFVPKIPFEWWSIGYCWTWRKNMENREGSHITIKDPGGLYQKAKLTLSAIRRGGQSPVGAENIEFQ